MINFTVLGKAQPAGSKRAFVIPGTNRARVTDANPKSKSWQQEVKHVAAQAYDAEANGLLEGPLSVTFRFVIPRPKNHFRTGKNSHLLRDAAPAYPTTKPDALKLARGVEDALTGTIYRDDSQIVVERLLKEYGETAKCVVEIEALGGHTSTYWQKCQ